jgi:hypothetical protein
MAKRIPNLQSEFYTNKSDEPVELMIAAGESVRVFGAYSDLDTYVVASTEQEQQSVILHPGERLHLI